jgi:predicted NBD/HSP70 family sugar kinase
MSSILGVDLGGTKIAAARYNATTWKQEESVRIETNADRGFDSVTDALITVIQDLKTDDTSALGIGVPGLVHNPEGIILNMPNIPGGESLNIAHVVKEKTGLDATVENDANCFALAEAVFGAGNGHSVVVAVTMGTGVGGGIILDGKIFQGSHGFAAEFGHMLLKPGEPPYKTDNMRGEVEQFLSGTAMGKRCEQADNPEEYLEGSVCEFMRPDVFREVAWLCTNLIHVLDPSVIVFGGSAGRALRPYIPNVTAEIMKWILPGTPLPEIKIAELRDAATRGAALLATI